MIEAPGAELLQRFDQNGIRYENKEIFHPFSFNYSEQILLIICINITYYQYNYY